jgi:GT2 family glycosyltransferase
MVSMQRRGADEALTRACSVSVVICCYTEDRWEQIVAAIDSVRAQSRPPFEIVLVVDYNDRLLQRARAELGGVIVTANGDEKGLSGGKNTGLRVAGGDVVAFLDDDAVAAPDWLDVLCAHLDDPRVVGVGSAVQPAWQSEAPAWFPPEFYWVVGCSYAGLPERAAEVRNVFGGAMLVRREAALACGGFRTDLGRVLGVPAGCEETEFCIRLRQRTGGRFVYEPAAEIAHHVPSERLRLAYFVRRCFHEGVSKARVARWVGRTDALEAERRYVTRTLPRGVIRGVAAIGRGRVTGLLSAAAITAGVGAACVGYASASLPRRGQHASPDRTGAGA